MDRPALVLLVDGSLPCREMYHSILAWGGYEVLEAPTGEEALYLTREHRPVLVITEFPVPLPGWPSLTEAIRADPTLSGICILTVTAHAVAEYRQRAFRAGVDGFLAKPLRPRRLLELVEHFICTRGAAA